MRSSALRRIGKLRQPPRNLGFSNTCRPNHDYVFRHDLFREIRRELLPPHAIAQRNGHGALGGVLADNVFIELVDDFARRQLVKRDLFFFSGRR